MLNNWYQRTNQQLILTIHEAHAERKFLCSRCDYETLQITSDNFKPVSSWKLRNNLAVIIQSFFPSSAVQFDCKPWCWPSLSQHGHTWLVKVLGSILSMFWPVAGKGFCSVDLQWAIFSKSNKREKEKLCQQIITCSGCNQFAWLSSYPLLLLKLRFEMPKSILTKKCIFSLHSNIQIFIELCTLSIPFAKQYLRCWNANPNLLHFVPEVSAEN